MKARIQRWTRIGVVVSLVVLALQAVAYAADRPFPYFKGARGPGGWVDSSWVQRVVYNQARGSSNRVCQAVYAWPQQAYVSYTCGWYFTSSGSLPYMAYGIGYAQNAHTGWQYLEGTLVYRQ